MSHRVFISHATSDKNIADAVVEQLESQDIPCWIAPRDIVSGMDWSDSIIDALEDSQLMLLIFSSAANESEHVKREIQNAVNEHVAILPLMIENVPLSKHMRYFIGTSHWLDATQGEIGSHLAHIGETVGLMLSRFDSQDDLLMMGLDDFEENDLAEAGVKAHRLKKGETLFHQNDPGSTMYVLVDGRMDIKVQTAHNEERLIATLEPTAILGEMSMFLNHDRTASAIARTDVFLWEVAHATFASALSQKQRWAVKLLFGISQIMARRLNSMVNEVAAKAPTSEVLRVSRKAKRQREKGK